MPSYCWYQTSDRDTRHEIVYDKCGIVCEGVDTTSHEVQSNRCSTPLRLQSVCLRWTSIALDRPSTNRSTRSNQQSGFIATTVTTTNKKLSYRRETARQLPTWREGGVRPSSPLPPRPLWLHLCVWLNPKATTYVRQA